MRMMKKTASFRIYALTLTWIPIINAWNVEQRLSFTQLPRARLHVNGNSHSATIRPRKVNYFGLRTHEQEDAEERHNSLFEKDSLDNDDNQDMLERNITAAVEQKIRVAKAQSEIDKILSGPDAPFDMKTEMKRVVSIAPPITQSVEQTERDNELSILERDLYQAVKQEDFGRAHELRQEISQQHVDDCGAVLQVNSHFYRAFSMKDIRGMEHLWLKDGTVTCIHPSHKPLVGNRSVIKNWQRMFEFATKRFQRSWMEPHNIRLSVKGASTAIVTCDEHVFARRFVRGQKRQTELVNRLTATNIFRKVGDQWYMCYHHSSWHADSAAAKAALRSSGTVGATTATLQAKDGSKDIKRTSDNAAPEISMDGILGLNNGPLLGPSGKNKPVPGKPKLFMGSLSDILNGNLGDILSDKKGEGDGSESGAIIQFSRVDDDDDDDDSDDDDEDDDDEETEAVAIIKQWAESSDGSTNKKKKKEKKSEEEEDSGPKDALRQSCISALRKLAAEGSISAKQKRVLLTDIISCSAKGEFSMVEVAYELLCGEGEDKDAAQEEFAEQCRVFAHSQRDKSVSALESDD